MPLHFTVDELAKRREITIEKMRARGLDGMLLFRQESMYYLTGYDTFGYVFFQCLYLAADGQMTLLTRAPDARAAEYTSMLDDIRVWRDCADSNPAKTDLLPILEEHGCRDRRLGVEYEAYGLTGRNALRLRDALSGFCELDDASELITEQRAVKRPAEIEYVRKAAILGDAAHEEAIRLARPGAFEGDILAAMQSAVFRGDGDYPGNEFIIGSGPASCIGRYHSSRRTLEDDDVLTVEFAGVFRHYHSAMYRTIKIGARNEKHERMHDLAAQMLSAGSAAIVPGAPIGAIFTAINQTIEAGGYHSDIHAYGYGLGTTFAPNWMDWPMIYADNPTIMEPGMVLFMHPGVRDPSDGLAAMVGETVLITESGYERLSGVSLDYVRKN